MFGMLLLILAVAYRPCLCWDQEELDLFDLVEEIGENFYELMRINEDATTADVRRAYRQLSLELHPDKSNDPDAAEKFRKMVAVSEVLKDDVKRQMYDRILVEGLPDWKQPLFYYRRMRKMGLMELTVMFLVVSSVGHYLYGLAVYAEKQIILQDVLTRKQKKEQRKSRHGKSQLSQQKLEAEMELLNSQAQASIPHIKDLLPILLVKNLFRFSLLAWKLLHRKRLSSLENIPPDKKEDRDNVRKPKPVPHRRQVWTSTKRDDESKDVWEDTLRDVEGKNEDIKLNGRRRESSETASTNNTEEMKNIQVSSPEGDHCKHAEDVAVMTTYASNGGGNGLPGTKHHVESDREGVKIQEEKTLSNKMNARETKKKKKSVRIREYTSSDLPVTTHKENGAEQTAADNTLQEKGNRTKPIKQEVTSSENRANRSGSNASKTQTVPLFTWTRYQQSQLEWALSHYPKFSSDRWLNIARAVPGKSQEECIERCKQIHEDLKRKRTA